MEWDICCICQVQNSVQLRGRSSETPEDREKSYNKISNTINGLRDRDLIEESIFDRFGCQNTVESISETLSEHRAVYHHNCVSNIHRKLTRALEKEAKAKQIP